MEGLTFGILRYFGSGNKRIKRERIRITLCVAQPRSSPGRFSLALEVGCVALPKQRRRKGNYNLL